MSRTSETHPLQIAEVQAFPNFGRVGITFCPGKKDSYAKTGAWNRDLDTDLTAIAKWGAVAVITLLEPDEISLLQVTDLGREVRRKHMDWLHMPIADVSVPGSAFEKLWADHGEGIRARIRDGFDVLVHCRGGLGRAGLVAARLLIELGVPAQTAIVDVRRARPGAIETKEQEAYVLGQKAVPEYQPETTSHAIKDRAIGAFLGLAVGDALGTTLEFRKRGTFEPISEIVGGGPFQLKPGEWTDDTSMALALAESLSARGGIDEADVLDRFCDWYKNGAYSSNGRCFDIGNTTRDALEHWKTSGEVHAGSTDARSAGNGSLMRLAPVAIRFWNDRNQLKDAAARQSKTTHGAPEAVDACVAFALMLADAIEGAPRSQVLRPRTERYAGKISAIAQGSWRKRGRDTIESSGYVAHGLEASLWSFARTGDFRSAISTAANLGDDADTTAAITGQLAGAIYGASRIPPSLTEKLAFSGRILEASHSVFGHSGGSHDIIKSEAKSFVSDLFHPEPSQWGLRGDRYLWLELEERLSGIRLPSRESTLWSILEEEYERSTGRALSAAEIFVVDRFAHGGMSSGAISPAFWSHRGFPLLVYRLSRQRPGTGWSSGIWSMEYE